MKKVLGLLLSSLLTMITICGCDITSPSNNNNDDGKISVVTTIFPQYDFVREIAGDKVNLTMLLSPGAESHSYEPAPQDIIKIQNSDLFIYVGGEGDVWVDTILKSDSKKVNSLTLMECVDTVEEEIVEGMEEEEEEKDEDEPELDEHVWTSLPNAVKITERICDELCTLDPENADEYNKRTSEYIGKIETLDSRIRKTVSEGKRNTIIFGDRFPFRYFADEYDLEYYAAFPGCSEDTEPSAQTVSFLIDKVKKDEIPVVFGIEFSNKKLCKTISDATGAEILEMHSCHNISNEDLKSGTVTYLSLMEQNAENLEKALQ